MKNTIYLLIFCLCFPLLAMSGSQPEKNPQVELAKVEKVFQSYFDGIKKYDYHAMRQACTPDYLLFEDGVVWTVEDHINFLKPLEGKATITYTFVEVEKHIDGSVAWLTYRNVADAVFDGKPAHFEWIESCIFHRQNGVWKIALLHSTTAKPTPKQ